MVTVDYLRAFGAWLMDFIFPVRCLACAGFSASGDAGWLCDACLAALPVATTPTCIVCTAPAPQGDTCPQCKPQTALDRVLEAGSYADPLLRRVVTTMKYRFVPALASQCATLIERRLAVARQTHDLDVFKTAPLVTAVPLHPYRLNWRGFNQAELIARRLAGTHGLNFAPLLARRRRTVAQATIADSRERAQNTSGAFACLDPAAVNGREVIIIDDVCTSGATLNECAKILKSAGAKSVTALVVARG